MIARLTELTIISIGMTAAIIASAFEMPTSSVVREPLQIGAVECQAAEAISVEGAAETQQIEAEDVNISQQIEPQMTYLGTWTTTAYCACPICCGEWSNGYTASGTLATQGRTVACGILPFGTQIVIDGTTYTVEDTGVEGEWIDIYFDSHEDALNYGMRDKEVYLVEI